jgi:DNA-binding Xre family transcriptional regulator
MGNNLVLKVQLIDKNMKKIDLRDAAEISSNSIAKLGKNEPVRMDVLMKIAAALDCKVEDLFETMDYKDSKWASQILALQHNDGSWGHFHTLSNPTMAQPITTEQALAVSAAGIITLVLTMKSLSET